MANAKDAQNIQSTQGVPDITVPLNSNPTPNATVGKGGQKTNKAKIAILIASIAVVIGIVIAIVIVIINSQNQSNNGSSENEQSEQEAVPEVEVISKEALEIYNKASNEINQKLWQDDVTDEDSTGSEILNMYIEKIRTTENTQARAMLLSDYYQMLMVYQPNADLKDTIIGGLEMVDDALETVNSAMVVINAAEYYNDTETAEKYNKLADQRAKEGRYGYYDVEGDAG